MKGLLFSLCFIFLFENSLALASDLEREKRMLDEIRDVILDGDVVMLRDGDHDFLSIYTEAESAKRALLIMHGRGFHPDWADTVQPLRVGLVDYGWNTLSIQMPVLGKEAKYYDYLPIFDDAVPRIEAAIKYLRAQGNQKIVMLAHSCGVHMSMHYLGLQGDDELDAYIGIGMGATDYRQPMLEPFPLESIDVPVLDIYGSEDFPAVGRLAPQRWHQVQKAGNALSQQKVVSDADHYFTDRGERLVEVIGEWLSLIVVE